MKPDKLEKEIRKRENSRRDHYPPLEKEIKITLATINVIFKTIALIGQS